jgi:hypothetical protein
MPLLHWPVNQRVAFLKSQLKQKVMNSKFRILTLSLLTVCLSFSAQAQQSLIYGKVTTISGESYTGQIRWGKEEAFWTDLFNGNKEGNDNYRYLSREDRSRLREKIRDNNRWGGVWISWGSRDEYETTHEFQARFGDISSMEMNRRSEVRLTMRNGETMYVEDGSNDFNTDIYVMDQEFGETKIRWSRIEKVEFMDTPNKLSSKLGEPLYGTVQFYGGEYTGVIQWDHDERLTTDILDGDSRDGDVKIEFGNLASIEREGSGSRVITKSGRDMYLRGSNDVNSGNRGIIVTTEFGRIDIPWREFKKVTFSEAPANLKTYRDFAGLKKLSGTVTTTRGETLSGEIIYDLDEAYTFEMLQGEDHDVSYIIPFESVKSIVPKNYDNSLVVLKSGEELILGESRDVSEDNDGVIVFVNGDPKYILWEDIKEITFN